MTGTIFSVTEASVCRPPMNTTPASTTMMTPMSHTGMENAVFIVLAMELDCTMQPMKPSARMMETEKNPARNLPPLPLNAARM